ncbi:toxin-antitoxin system YwqK family antitoxin [Zobellia uliginosa]|uniref:toxin-antitoxin system YwqK family antitoxin n=1 Tax=Zobellia uliginosa TaxID=143224 RepID=UPI0026E2F8D3|nr:hypothetical protein [Zobellia uliginosa]MDO6516131.1 hypothetical protein [Zobellia uliginosa]
MRYLLLVYFSTMTLLSAQKKMEPITTPIGSLDIIAKNVDGKLKYCSSKGKALGGKYSISIRKEKERKQDYDGEGNDIPNTPFKGLKTDFNQLGFFVKGYKNGLWKTTFKNKLIKTENFKNGLLFGVYKVYDTNGNMLYNTNFGLNGDGRFKDFYYKSGILREEGSYKNGKKEGEWCYYDETGQSKTVKHYKEGVLQEK